jgi:UTP--glucose-1-phosphate uridylyltransferase
MKVTTAVIPAAGYGTRMLPITAGVQKVLLPILDRPVFDYVVDDCIRAGVTNIIIIINPNSHDLQSYYVGDQDLERHLKNKGKTEVLERLAKIHSKATFTFVEQPFESAGYGTNVTLQLAAPHLPKDEAFIFTNGDAFTWDPEGHSDNAAMVETFHRTKAAGVILLKEMPTEVLHRYGVAKIEDRSSQEYLLDFVEQPKSNPPSNAVSTFNFVLSPAILPYVMATKPNATGEGQFPDALMAMVNDNHPVAVQRAQGTWLDGGNLVSWLNANLTVLQSRPELAEQLLPNLRTLLEQFESSSRAR